VVTVSGENPVKGEVGTVECRRAIVRLAIIAAVFVAAAGLTYLIPAAEALRPWVPGDDAPMKRLYTFDWSKGISGSGTESDGALKGEMARVSLAEGLGEELAANLGSEAGVDQPVANRAADSSASQPSLISPDELVGLVRKIEDPSGKALDAFFRALQASASGRSVTRIAHWGDSTIAADDVTGTLRRRLQSRFGDAGHGFMLVGKGTMPYRHKDIETVQLGQWKQQMGIRRERRDGRYGYGGVAFTTWGGGSAWYKTVDKGPIGTRTSSFEVFFQSHPAGGKVNLAVDGKPAGTIDTRAGEVADGFRKIQVVSGPHRFDIDTEGEVRLYGVAIEDDGPGVVYDSLGMVGARAQRLQNFDPAHFAAQVAHRAPDLLVIAFGGNECGDAMMDFDIYRENLRKTIDIVMAGRPTASCMLLAPLDQGEVGPRGRIRTMPAIPLIVQAQREVAAEKGCAFFDTFSAMGGEGSMARWYKSRPRLGWGDYRHATPAGYEVIGNMIYKALLASFSEWLARSPEVEVPPSPGT